MSLAGPIISAGRRPLPPLVDGPDMRDVVTGWSRPMTLVVITLTAGPGGDAVETTRTVETSGLLNAIDPRKLNFKPEGDGTRNWKAWLLHVLNDPQIKDGDQLVIADVRYKVMKSFDRSQYGFFRFGLLEDFQPEK